MSLAALFGEEWLEQVAQPARPAVQRRSRCGGATNGCLFSDEVMSGRVVDMLIEALDKAVMAKEAPIRRVRTGIDAVRRNARIERDKGRLVAIVVNTAAGPDWFERQSFRMAGYGEKFDWTVMRLDALLPSLEGPPLFRRVEIRYGATPENLRWADEVDREYAMGGET